MGEKKRYDVISPISHNGKRYIPGSQIDLLPEEAGALVKAGAIKGDNQPVVDEKAGLEAKLKESVDRIESLQNALAKANERIKLLESMTRKEETKKGK